MSASTAPGFRDALRGIALRRDLEEILDRPDVDRRLLSGNLRDLRLLNARLLWSAALWRDVETLLRRHRIAEPHLLDIATGSADVPHHAVRNARRRGIHLRAVGSDRSAEILAEARQRAGSVVQLVQHTAERLPFRDRSFDVVTCCLAAHHLDPESLRQTLTEMWRVCRVGVIVADLARSRTGYVLARGMALVLRNPLTAHDGPVSVLRAYTPDELGDMARSANLGHVRVRTVFPARLALIAEREAGQ